MAPIKPMLAIASTGASGRHPVDVRALVATGDWVLDTKLDGVRAIIHRGRIYNRRGDDVTYKFPEISLDPALPTLDGEIVAADGSFESTLSRESMENRSTIKRWAETNPCVFVAFDLPEERGEGGTAATWMLRRARLEDLGVLSTPVSYDAGYIEVVREAGGEGVIAKRTAHRYQPGKRSADWVKHKFTSRTTCIAYGYEPGHGSRAHFGALKIALIKGDEVVPMGRTGSGFTDRQTRELKARLDKGEMFPVEIEHMLTGNGELRFPTFRGVRSDLELADCTYDQLE